MMDSSVSSTNNHLEQGIASDEAQVPNGDKPVEIQKKEKKRVTFREPLLEKYVFSYFSDTCAEKTRGSEATVTGTGFNQGAEGARKDSTKKRPPPQIRYFNESDLEKEAPSENTNVKKVSREVSPIEIDGPDGDKLYGEVTVTEYVVKRDWQKLFHGMDIMDIPENLLWEMIRTTCKEPTLC